MNESITNDILRALLEEENNLPKDVNYRYYSGKNKYFENKSFKYFDKLLSENKIVIKTKFTYDNNYINIILFIVYNKLMFYKFNNRTNLLDLFHKRHITISGKDYDLLFSYTDANIWIYYLKKVIVNNYGIHYYLEIPSVKDFEYSYPDEYSFFEQTIFTIDNMISNYGYVLK